MTQTYKTDQERFWAGAFGQEYIGRNRGAKPLAAATVVLAKVLARTTSVRSAIEFGANIGLNLHALHHLTPETELAAVEINEQAAAELKTLAWIEVFHQSILAFRPSRQWDLVLTSSVLIHINPESLDEVYRLLHRSSRRYICLYEYYNPTPVEVPYRDHREVLWKRDFAGEMLDTFPDLTLVDYGFAYRRDPNFPQDDKTWFLLEKR